MCASETRRLLGCDRRNLVTLTEPPELVRPKKVEGSAGRRRRVILGAQWRGLESARLSRIGDGEENQFRGPVHCEFSLRCGGLGLSCLDGRIDGGQVFTPGTTESVPMPTRNVYNVKYRGDIYIPFNVVH